jgi:hypothetical protein
MTYEQFQRLREVAKQRELKERAESLSAPRPPLQASITDQLLRDLIDRVAALEAQAALRVLAPQIRAT